MKTINIHKVMTQEEVDNSRTGDNMSSVFVIDDKKVLLMSSAREAFIGILQLDHRDQLKIVSAIMKGLPKVGDMAEIANENGKKTAYATRANPEGFDVDVLVMILR